MHPDSNDQGKTYTIDPSYRSSWARGARVALAAAAALVIAGVIAAVAGQPGLAVTAIVVAVVVGVPAFVIRGGTDYTSKHGYALTIEPTRLTVLWRDQVTHLPWDELEYGLVAENGPAYRALEVRPKPGVRYVLPRNARPRSSKLRPDNLEVFILSLLGNQQADCIGDVARYLDIR